WDSDKQSGQQCLTFTPEIMISKQILTFAQKNKFNALIADINLPLCETMKSTIQDEFIVIQKDIQTLFQKKLKKILLDIRMLPHSHTSEEIDEQLHAIFAAFDISTKILCATTNRGSNVILAMQSLKKNFVLQNNHFDFWSRRCQAHILNLIVTAAISSFSSITQDFRELEKSVGKTIIRYNKSLNKYKLSLQKEADLQAATQFLRPFYKTMNVLSGSTYTTLGLSILLVDDIINTILSCIRNSTSSEFLKAATTQISDKLQKYTDKIYNKMAFIAAIFDPRIKLELIPADMNTEVNRAIFNNIFRSEYFAPILNNSLTNSETLLNLSYTEQVAHKKRTNTLTNRTNEFTQYLNEAVLPMNYLAIQSTSVSSEQVFSKAGDTVRAKCTRLSKK
ncbi:13809_t:CDS:2, partial [Gigaspora margarita]